MVDMERQPDTILVIEDDEASRKLVRVVLGKRNYRIVEAENLAQARQFLASTVPGLVLLDIRLRDENGLTLATEIRNNPKLREVPIIAITAHALKDNQALILEAGCDAYLSKPINTRQLPEMVGKFLQEGRA